MDFPSFINGFVLGGIVTFISIVVLAVKRK